jgi:gamma-glutamylcyclotransferase (GGCT)/AIG2-like uncharacterized protein YtfP
VRFFFYGTLMDVEIRGLVLGRRDGARPVEPATLPGFRRVTMHRRSYPVIFPEPSTHVVGCLIRGLDRHAAARLDAFETDEYDRIECAVVLVSSRSIDAWTYVAGRRATPSTMAWDLEAWRRRHKREYRRRLR